ncbi:MAG: TlyA family RNA methyltransferase [Peptostreptococcaceae bacterium]|nr:TlyA family RNA methyltransferase [Peptostreptococcaceae bacterium]
MKKRIDVLLVEDGRFASREKAKANIMAGRVFADGLLVDKPGTMVDEGVFLTIKPADQTYVSRGGFKLEKAVNLFALDLQGKICMDIGASTGGFTDCMLQNGALKVYAVDVGYGQLDWKLRNDDRVVCMERTNIRHLNPEKIAEKIDFFSVDVSFISLKLVIPVIKSLIHSGSEAVLLIKPQFEAGKEEASKNGGVIKDQNTQKRVIDEIMAFCIQSDFEIANLSYSPIKGPKGNIEFLLYIRSKKSSDFPKIDIGSVVDEAHAELQKK